MKLVLCDIYVIRLRLLSLFSLCLLAYKTSFNDPFHVCLYIFLLSQKNYHLVEYLSAMVRDLCLIPITEEM